MLASCHLDSFVSNAYGESLTRANESSADIQWILNRLSDHAMLVPFVVLVAKVDILIARKVDRARLRCR